MGVETLHTQQKGSLVVVGTGLTLAGHLSAEARRVIIEADIVLALMGDRVVEAWLRTLNPRLERLEDQYEAASSRPRAYRAMSERMLELVRSGLAVVVALYGHPGVFVTPSHEAIARARAEGFNAVMLPAISAEDCLFADLGVDPGASGCQSYEARDFFAHARAFDPSAALILWQIAVLGDGAFRDFAPRPGALAALALVLLDVYPPAHRVAVYAGARLPTERPRIDWLKLEDLHLAEIDQSSTLYVPPLREPSPSPSRLALLESMLSAAER
ncbi:MAG: hypothetical protein JNJ63_00490 [Hyphomonadaceae bacterium]|nr:hypothetical protein [Hyphomonadaceae bacterium]